MNKNIYKIRTHNIYVYVCVYELLFQFNFFFCIKNSKISLIYASNDLSILGTADISVEQKYIPYKIWTHTYTYGTHMYV